MDAVMVKSKHLSAVDVWESMTRFPRWLASPTILATWPVKPRWQIALQHAGVLTLLAANSLAWYAYGGYSAGSHRAREEPAAASLMRPPAEANHPTDLVAQLMSPAPAMPGAEDAAGLRIENFRIGAVAGARNRLQYELGLSNKGRKLAGKLEFIVLGEQNGRVSELPLDAAALTDAKPRVEVARLLNTRGYLDLPEGYVVHKVVVNVVDGETTRVSQSAPMWPT